MNPNQKEMKIEIKVDDQIAAGNYSNFTNISHSPDEFIMDFLFLNPTPPPGFGKLQSRIILSPSHAKKVLLALQQNISQYENRFGEIEIVNNQNEIKDNLQ